MSLLEKFNIGARVQYQTTVYGFRGQKQKAIKTGTIIELWENTARPEFSVATIKLDEKKGGQTAAIPINMLTLTPPSPAAA